MVMAQFQVLSLQCVRVSERNHTADPCVKIWNRDLLDRR